MADENDTTRVDPLDDQYAHLGLIEEPGITAYVDMLTNKDGVYQGAFASGYSTTGDVFYVIRNEEEGRTSYYTPTLGGNTAVYRGMVQYDDGETFKIYQGMPQREPYPNMEDHEYFRKEEQAHLDFEDDFELLQSGNPARPPLESDTETVSLAELEGLAKRAVDVEEQRLADYMAQRRAEQAARPDTQEPQQPQQPQGHEQGAQTRVAAPTPLMPSP